MEPQVSGWHAVVVAAAAGFSDRLVEIWEIILAAGILQAGGLVQIPDTGLHRFGLR